MAEASIPKIEWHLRIGTRLTGFVVRPDGKWPDMWRIYGPTGRVSDMVNLSRARDAAIAWARPRGLGGGERVFWDRREIAPGTALAAAPAAGAPR